MHGVRDDTGHLFFRKIEKRPHFFEATRATFEYTASGELINREDEPLGKIYIVFRGDKDAFCPQERIVVLDPDYFHFKTLVRVE